MFSCGSSSDSRLDGDSQTEARGGRLQKLHCDRRYFAHHPTNIFYLSEYLGLDPLEPYNTYFSLNYSIHF